MSIRAVRHVGVVVSDMGRSLGFYRDLLGLRVESDRHESGDFIEKLLAIPGVAVRTVKLAAPQGATLIELLEFAGKAHSPDGSGNLRRLGPTHAALTVGGIDALHAHLSAHGVRFLSPPCTSPDGIARVAFCADPDGVMLELVEPLA